jgi:hypothetical protein
MLRLEAPPIYKGEYNCSKAPCLLIIIFSVLLSDQPDVVIGTPSRALNLLQSKVRLTNSQHISF